MRLEGACTLLTGAGSGIGQALAVALAAKGARLILADLRREGLEETMSMLDDPAKAVPIVADVTNVNDRAAMVQAVTQNFGRLNLLINNAGAINVEPITRTSDEALRLMTDVNLVAPMALVRDLADLLESSAPSRVVNIGSMFGDIAFPLFAAYSATKFGIRGFSDALRREFHVKDIGVTYVAPRATRTPASRKFEHLIAPFNMAFDTPEKVAKSIVAGIEKDKRSVYPMGPERIFVLVQRLFPGVIDSNLIFQLAGVEHLKID
ncbi:MAG: hypothetical protein A3G18_08255 [Rhodospirillales bacterium RIFCSPLOWO2_12_FULL_58_28]|nr:MAG: hypothetical protein A3H92_09680 [Rhodospirillales bacterium RIFCSPLOWO2_02_FULL_58_16]OHC79130.1 MAG: hypothetical protein A3G18_08255 [Rhodospirillales bacterium RIFCSPLOWO2_12_FULL_58_28]